MLRGGHVALAALLLAAPLASASPIHGSLAPAWAADLAGTLDVSTGEGVLNLTPLVGAGLPLALHADRVEGHRVSQPVAGADAGPLEEAPPTGDVHDDPVDARNATLHDFACQEDCLVLLVADGHGRLGLVGAASGPLGSLAVARSFCSRFCGGEPNFERDEPAGALVAGPALLQAPRVVASGDVKLLLKGVTALLDTPQGQERIEAATTRDPLASPLPPTIYRGADRHAYFALGNVSVPRGEGPAELVAAEARLSLEGALASPDATGTLTYAGETRSFHDEALRLEGALALDATRAPVAAPVADGLAGSPLDSGVSGDATLLRLGAHETRPVPAAAPALEIAARVGLGGALLAGLALLARALLAPLYSRIAPANALANANRARIHALLCASPGQSPADLARATGIPRVVVRHHLAVLEAQRLVVARRVERRVLYLPSQRSLDPEALRAKAQLRSGTRRRLAEIVGAAPEGLTQGDIIARTGLSRRLVAYHLRRLAGLGLVEHDGAVPRRYRSSPRLAASLTPR